MNLLFIIQQQRKGKFITEATEKLQALVKQCRSTGKVGELIIKLKVKPASNGEMLIVDDCTPKMPKPETTASLFYDDENGALLKDDPKQPEFPAVVQESQAVNQ